MVIRKGSSDEYLRLVVRLSFPPANNFLVSVRHVVLHRATNATPSSVQSSRRPDSQPASCDVPVRRFTGRSASKAQCCDSQDEDDGGVELKLQRLVIDLYHTANSSLHLYCQYSNKVSIISTTSDTYQPITGNFIIIIISIINISLRLSGFETKG